MKKRVKIHAKDVMCYQENEEYYLNRFPKKAKKILPNGKNNMGLILKIKKM